jgi:hypothetical protein
MLKIETKRRLAALVGYPIAWVFYKLDGEKDSKQHMELFKDRIFGKRLKDTVASKQSTQG